MNHCMGGTKRKYVIERLVVPSIWPMQERTNLSQDEVKFHKEVGFVFNKMTTYLSSKSI